MKFATHKEKNNNVSIRKLFEYNIFTQISIISPSTGRLKYIWLIVMLLKSEYNIYFSKNQPEMCVEEDKTWNKRLSLQVLLVVSILNKPSKSNEHCKCKKYFRKNKKKNCFFNFIGVAKISHWIPYLSHLWSYLMEVKSTRIISFGKLEQGG